MSGRTQERLIGQMPLSDRLESCASWIERKTENGQVAHTLFPADIREAADQIEKLEAVAEAARRHLKEGPNVGEPYYLRSALAELEDSP